VSRYRKKMAGDPCGRGYCVVVHNNSQFDLYCFVTAYVAVWWRSTYWIPILLRCRLLLAGVYVVGEEALWRGWFCSCFLPHELFPSPTHPLLFILLLLFLALADTPLVELVCRIMAVGKDKVKRWILQDFDGGMRKGCRGWNVEMWMTESRNS
jgi:hypothetical protein